MRQYNPTKVVGSWTTPGPFGVVDILDGVVDGPFFSQSSDNPVFGREHDLRGNACRVKNENRGGTFSITLAADSPTNLTLSKIAALDRTSENQVGLMLLRDLNGDTVIEAVDAYLADTPDGNFGADRGANVWLFEYGSADKVIGGRDLA